MTGDDDAVGGAVRRALYRIGFADAIRLRPWADIRARARRLQRRRVAVGVVIVASLLTGAGAANALVARGDANTDLDVTASSTTTTPDTNTSTSAGVAPSTGRAPTLGSSLSTPGAPPPNTTTPVSQPELVGTITVADTTLVAEAPVAVTLTIRNTTDHVWRSDVQPPVHLGIRLAPDDRAGVCVDAQPSDFMIDPGEQRP
jgi:hypothetical protein